MTERAARRCEYCLVHEADRPEAHQMDHIFSRKHGGQTSKSNLTLACAICNNYKGTDFASINPTTEVITRIFHPRRELWRAHFEFSGAEIIGLTVTGQATVQMLQLNHPDRLAFRQSLIEAGLYPPPSP